MHTHEVVPSTLAGAALARALGLIATCLSRAAGTVRAMASTLSSRRTWRTGGRRGGTR